MTAILASASSGKPFKKLMIAQTAISNSSNDGAVVVQIRGTFEDLDTLCIKQCRYPPLMNVYPPILSPYSGPQISEQRFPCAVFMNGHKRVWRIRQTLQRGKRRKAVFNDIPSRFCVGEIRQRIRLWCQTNDHRGNRPMSWEFPGTLLGTYHDITSKQSELLDLGDGKKRTLMGGVRRQQNRLNKVLSENLGQLSIQVITTTIIELHSVFAYGTPYAAL